MVDRIAPDQRSEEKTNIPSGNGTTERIRYKFRTAVGRAMEEIPDEELRAGLRKTQEEVLTILEGIKLHSFVPDEQAQKYEDVLIEKAVNEFFARMALAEERKLRQALKAENDTLKGEVRENHMKLKKEMEDELTGLYRKKYLLAGFRRTLSLLLREAYDKPIPLSVAFIDIDHFKGVNDTYGHEAGDRVLKAVGNTIRKTFQRDSDITGRFGGEEFVIVLPHCDEKNALKVVERLREAIGKLEFKADTNGGEATFKITFTAGVLASVLHKIFKENVDETLKYMLQEADVLMYEGKRGGRNRSVSKMIDIGEMPDDEGALV